MGEIWSGLRGRTAAGAVTTGASWRRRSGCWDGSESWFDVVGEGVGSERLEEAVEAGEGVVLRVGSESGKGRETVAMSMSGCREWAKGTKAVVVRRRRSVRNGRACERCMLLVFVGRVEQVVVDTV